MSKYKLIISISNNGYSDEIIETAKGAGARGGTILHGKSSAISEETKFFGIKIYPEKDLIMIVSEKDKYKEIMDAIAKNHGVGRDAHALCFCLPIDETIGFNF